MIVLCCTVSVVVIYYTVPLSFIVLLTTETTKERMSVASFAKDRHIRYFAKSIQEIPAPYCRLDSNRLTLVHFATHALDLLGVWDDSQLVESLKLKPDVIVEWIYSLQVSSNGHFQGGNYVGSDATTEYHQGHIAMTYTALCTLLVLGDDLSRIDKKLLLESTKALQRPDGSFQCTHVPSEHDMRFLYCACAISHILNDWSGINVDLAVQYIESCRAYDGGVSLIPGQVRIV